MPAVPAIVNEIAVKVYHVPEMVASFRCRRQQIDRGNIGRISRPGFVEYSGKKFLVLLAGESERKRDMEFHGKRFLSAINGGRWCGKLRRTKL